MTGEGVVHWPSIVFGWPTIVLSVVIFTVAFSRQRSALGFVALACSAPFLWYASGAPRGLLFSPLLLAANAAAAMWLFRGRKRLAAVSLLPYGTVVVAVAIAVLAQ